MQGPGSETAPAKNRWNSVRPTEQMTLHVSNGTEVTEDEEKLVEGTQELPMLFLQAPWKF